MTKIQIEKYNEHAKFMADIALAILKGNKNILDVNGVKEIIALYLLIPYVTPKTLRTPDENCIIPDVGGNFCDRVTLESLRNAICHSFVTVEEDKNDGTMHGKYLIVDDRAICNGRKEHDALGVHSTATHLPIDYTHKKLIELFEEIVKQKVDAL